MSRPVPTSCIERRSSTRWAENLPGKAGASAVKENESTSFMKKMAVAADVAAALTAVVTSPADDVKIIGRDADVDPTAVSYQAEGRGKRKLHNRDERALTPEDPGYRSSCCRFPFCNYPVTYGGWGGIRTHGTVSRTPVFKTGSLNHSDTHPTP